MLNSIIRQAKIKDIEGIVKLWKELMDFHLPFDKYFEMREEAPVHFQRFLKDNIINDDRIVVVAQINDEIVGYMMGIIAFNPPVFKLEKYGEITDACVSGIYRNQDLGLKLFKEIKRWFKDQDLTRIDINAAANNPISNKFWKKMGFKPYLNHMYNSI